MRVASLLVVAVVLASSSAQQAKFVTKFKNLLSDYLDKNTEKACDMVVTDIMKGMTIQEIMSDIMSNVLTLVPSSKYFPALTMLSTFDGCLKKCGSSTDKAMGNIGFAFNKHLTPVYKKCAAKVAEMKKAKKPDAAIKTQLYNLATAALTKKLVQQIILTSMSKSTEGEYNCSMGPLNTIMKTANYNMAFNKKG